MVSSVYEIKDSDEEKSIIDFLTRHELCWTNSDEVLNWYPSKKLLGGTGFPYLLGIEYYDGGHDAVFFIRHDEISDIDMGDFVICDTSDEFLNKYIVKDKLKDFLDEE